MSLYIITGWNLVRKNCLPPNAFSCSIERPVQWTLGYLYHCVIWDTQKKFRQQFLEINVAQKFGIFNIDRDQSNKFRKHVRSRAHNRIYRVRVSNTYSSHQTHCVKQLFNTSDISNTLHLALAATQCSRRGALKAIVILSNRWERPDERRTRRRSSKSNCLSRSLRRFSTAQPIPAK